MTSRPRKYWPVVAVVVLLGIGFWQIWINKYNTPRVLFGDTDHNGRLEKYILRDKQVLVWEDRESDKSTREQNTASQSLLWQSDKAWDVRQITLADADNDGQSELLLVLWKKGSYGHSKPRWFKGSDDTTGCHLFMYRLTAGKMKAVWCSSALEHPIIKLQVGDSNGDGLNELQVTEGPRAGFAYRLRQTSSHNHTRWVWNGWGFEQM
jgi:hypothetical protein